MEKKIHSTKEKMPLKITTIGDGMVGKTCLLITYTKKRFPTEYVPTVFDNYPDTINVDGKDHDVILWDTAGQEDYERLRPLSYPNTDCFLMCYSVASRSSFDNILSKWYPEVKHHCPDVPVVLVATKTDLRATDHDSVSTAEGKKMRRKIKAVKLLECSAMNKEGLENVFVEAVRVATRVRPKKCRECKVL
ncbi:ras-like GTP-binding protein RhoL [Nilaparvata lugens]|uniref:ras-like GTP-binding protein RhoL n=2 Tax=Nilaparvata lugens TaxID=108931 RepID=UPI000B9959CF|nr:ras-like GTP-binding protein RhoL [Nilaparvata lugens]